MSTTKENNDNESFTDQTTLEEVTETPIVETLIEENSEIHKVSAELADIKDKYLRLQADFENFRKRTSKEKIELISSANKALILELLPVMDDIERAEKNITDEPWDENTQKGIKLVFGKFKKTLISQGLKEMETIGQDFDVELHEAITQIPVSDDNMKGKIVDEIEKGFFLGDKIIRFAKVITGI